MNLLFYDKAVITQDTESNIPGLIQIFYKVCSYLLHIFSDIAIFCSNYVAVLNRLFSSSVLNKMLMFWENKNKCITLNSKNTDKSFNKS